MLIVTDSVPVTDAGLRPPPSPTYVIILYIKTAVLVRLCVRYK